ncbi:unnamed protein product [Sphagnum jensenii]|uniref:Uncharacterized protein n=1 Tax=Sphagnum jensenii TaxID=128206 RepID=A0ABP0X706_9BRYO
MSTPTLQLKRDSMLNNVLLQSEVMLGWQRYGSGVTSFRIVQWSGGKVSCQCSSMLSSDLLLKDVQYELVIKNFAQLESPVVLHAICLIDFTVDDP